MTRALTGAQKEDLIRALRGSFDHASLSRMVEVGLDVRLGDEIAYPQQPLRDLVPRVVDWAAEHGRTADLLAAAAHAQPDHVELNALVARLGERVRGERPTGDDADQPPLPDGTAEHRLYVVATREDAVLRRQLEQRLRPLILSGRLMIVGRRQIDAGGTHDEPLNPRLATADLVVVLASPGLVTSSYLWSEEGQLLVDRHYQRLSQVVVVQAAPVTLAETPLDGLDALAQDTLDGEHELGDELIRVLGRVIDRRGADDWRARYLTSFHARMTEVDRELRSYIEPTKDVVMPRGDPTARRPAVVPGARSRSAPLDGFIAQLRGERVFALLGEPGAGKSLVLRRHAALLAERAQRDPARPLPVLVKLGGYTAPGGLLDFLRASLAGGRPAERAIARELEPLLRDGKIALLLDGMDEMPRRDFPDRVAALRALVNEYRGCQVVVACRVLDFDATQFDVCQIRLRPFNRADVARYLAGAVPLPPAEARRDAARLCAAGSRFASVAGNPFYLALLAASRAAGDYPDLVSDLFADHMTRALGAEGAEVVTSLRRDIELLAYEMTESGTGTAAATPGLLDRIAGRTETPGSALVDRLVRAGLVRRDESTGATVFGHARVQELFVAAHVARLPAAARLAWLEARAAEPWLEEVFVLVAREAVELDDLAAWIADAADVAIAAAEAEVTLASERALEPHEIRLGLVGRLSESTKFRADTLARLDGLLGRLWALRARRNVPDDAAALILRAARGSLAAQPRCAALLREAVGLRRADLRRRAWSALASTRRPADDRRLRLAILSQAVTTNHTRAVMGDLQAVADDPRLSRQRRTVVAAFGLHLLLLLATTAAIAFLPPRWVLNRGDALWVVLVLVGFHTALAIGHQEDRPSSLRVLAGLLVTSATMAAAVWVPGALVMHVGRGVVERRVDPAVVGVVAAMCGVIFSFLSVGLRRIVASWERAVLVGGALGFAIASEPAARQVTLVPYLIVAGVAATVVAVAILARLRVTVRQVLLGAAAAGLFAAIALIDYLDWGRYAGAALGAALAAVGVWGAALALGSRLRRARGRTTPRSKVKLPAAFAAIAVGAVVVVASLGAASLTGTVMGWIGGLLGGFSLISAIAVAVYGFIKYNTRAQASRLVDGPCTPVEAQAHLEALASGSLVRTSRAQVLWRLQGHAPLTRLVELTLMTVRGDWSDEPALVKALGTLRDRRQRARGDSWASLDDELAIAAVIAGSFAGQARDIFRQWLAEAGAEVEAAVRARAATVPAAAKVMTTVSGPPAKQAAS